MKSTTLSLLFLLFVFASHSQDLQTWSELNSAKNYGETAKREASSALSKLERSNAYSTLKEMLEYAEDAGSDISSAERSAGWAVSDASDAAYQADRIECSNAEDRASKAKNQLESAKSKLSSPKAVLDRMGSSAHREHEAGLLRDAISQLKEAIGLLEAALNEIETALQELNSCT